MSESIASQASSLPLRQDDPFSMVFLIKGLVVAIILLGTLYVLLRFYAKRHGALSQPSTGAMLECVCAIRLSSKTKVYLLRVEGKSTLVTEHASGATLTVISDADPIIPTAP